MRSSHEEWFVGIEGKSYGPFSFEILRREAAAGRILRDAFVWTPGMASWQAAGDVQGLFEIPRSPPPQEPGVPQSQELRPAPADRGLGENDDHLDEASRGQVQLEVAGAWRRLFARWIDLWLTTLPTLFLAGFVLALASPAWSIWIQDPTHGGLFAWLMIPVTFIVDAVIVALFGNSLGKALLRIRVNGIQGDQISFISYLRRNFRVWIYGFGLCIPFVALFTMISQARKLKRERSTGYDSGRYLVTGGTLSTARSLVAAGVVLLLAGVMVYLNVAQQSEQRSYLTGHRWTNPATSAEVQIPPGWIAASQSNDQGQLVHMFTFPRDNLMVVFGREDLSRGMTGAAYAQAFPFAVKNAMTLDKTVETGLMSGKNSWSTSGYMVADPERRVSVTIVQRDNQMWRTVAVRFNNMPPETESYRILRERLFASIK